METVAVNVSGKARRVSWNGREYLVAPATLLLERVLNGSKGPLFYPGEEIRKNPDAWNAMPIVLRHPVRDGLHVSARDPDILAEQGLGHVWRAAWNDRLDTEAWFDVLHTERHDRALPEAQRIIGRLERGEPVELSTGLYTDNEPAAPGAVHDGQPYSFIARNYRPDHVAVLPDEVGACSVKDGCGVLVNEADRGLFRRLVDWLKGGGKLPAIPEATTNNAAPEGGKTEETTVGKKELVEWLTVNCSCWKKRDAVLNAMPEEALATLKGEAEKSRTLNVIVANAKAARRAVVNAPAAVADGEVAPGINIGDLAKFLGVETDPGQDPAGFIRDILAKLDEIEKRLGDEPEPPEAPDDALPADVAPTAMSATPTGNRGKKMTANQWLATAPPEIQSAVKSAMEIERAERTRLVRQLTANVADEPRRKKLWAKFMAQPVDELRDLVSLLPAEEYAPEPLAANYFGATGSPAEPVANELEVLDLESARQEYDPVVTNRRKAAGA
jgi:hypothetical protein